MPLQPKVILLGLLALSAGAATIIFYGLGRSRTEVDDGITGLPDGPNAEAVEAKSGAALDTVPKEKAPKSDTVEAAGQRPPQTSTPAPDAALPPDPRLQALMADVRAALRSIPVEKITGTNLTMIPALLTELEPVLERDLAAHLAREAQRSRGRLDAAAESAFLRSASFYAELPKLAALVVAGRAALQIAEPRKAQADAVLCTNGPDGKVRRAVVSTPQAQWTLSFGMDPAIGANDATPRRGADRRQPFQGGNNGENGNGNGGGNNQRGRRRRSGG